MFLYTPDSGAGPRKIVNLDGAKEIYTRLTAITSPQGKRKVVSAIEAKMADGEEMPIAFYTEDDMAEDELDEIAKAIRTGAKLYDVIDDPEIMLFFDEQPAAAAEAED